MQRLCPFLGQVSNSELEKQLHMQEWLKRACTPQAKERGLLRVQDPTVLHTPHP
jgi:hypothetical protein